MKKIIVSFLLVVYIQNVIAITYRYMEHMCGREIDLDSHDSVRLKFTPNSISPRITCTLRVKTNSGNQMMLFFKEFHVSPCRNGGGLYLYDGRSTSSDFVSGLHGKQCGNYISSVYETSGNNLFLRFEARNPLLYKSNFDMVITQYHTGSCDSDEFSCSNDRCISDSLRCNGYNPCGDYSDCPLAVGIIVGIVIGSIAFIVSVVVVIVIICRRRRNAYAGRTVNQPLATVGGGQPYPQQYPSVQQYPGQPYPQY